MEQAVDFEKLTWKCLACNQERAESKLKNAKHDFSKDMNLPAGTVFINVRHCADNKMCIDKSGNREWIRKNLFMDT